MKRRITLLAFFALALTGCSKTNELYGRSQYNSVNFDENYYTSWDGVDKIDTSEKSCLYNKEKLLCQTSIDEIKLQNGSLDFNPNKYVYVDRYNEGKDNEFGYKNCLSKTTNNKEFKYGVLSKLFDGRVWCEGLYNYSRVQLNKTGFAMRFTKYLLNAKYLAFSVRGGTDFKDAGGFGRIEISVNFVWSFYREVDGKYVKNSFNLSNVKIPVDDSSKTAFIAFFPFYGENFDSEIAMSEAMSFEWSCNDLPDNTTDDYKIKEKHHLSLMLYEMFIGESSWC